MGAGDEPGREPGEAARSGGAGEAPGGAGGARERGPGNADKERGPGGERPERSWTLDSRGGRGGAAGRMRKGRGPLRQARRRAGTEANESSSKSGGSLAPAEGSGGRRGG